MVPYGTIWYLMVPFIFQISNIFHFSIFHFSQTPFFFNFPFSPNSKKIFTRLPAHAAHPHQKTTWNALQFSLRRASLLPFFHAKYCLPVQLQRRIMLHSHVVCVHNRALQCVPRLCFCDMPVAFFFCMFFVSRLLGECQMQHSERSSVSALKRVSLTRFFSYVFCVASSWRVPKTAPGTVFGFSIAKGSP